MKTGHSFLPPRFTSLSQADVIDFWACEKESGDWEARLVRRVLLE